jgi:cytochrome P450
MEQNLTPFGLGSRTCIGKNISLLELNKVVPVLVRDFDFDFLGKDGSLETRNYLQVSNKWFIKLPHFRGRVLKRAHPAM